MKAHLLSFDPAAPPIDPPVECADLVMWAIARELFADHEAEPSDLCPSCLLASACPGNELARQGLAAACGADNAMTAYWRELARIRAREADR